MAWLFSVLIIFALSIPTSLLQGWGLSTVWSWFVVPLGLPAIGVIHAIGLMITYSLFTLKVGNDTKATTTPWELFEQSFVQQFVRCFLVLFLVCASWCFHQFL